MALNVAAAERDRLEEELKKAGGSAGAGMPTTLSQLVRWPKDSISDQEDLKGIRVCRSGDLPTPFCRPMHRSRPLVICAFVCAPHQERVDGRPVTPFPLGPGRVCTCDLQGELGEAKELVRQYESSLAVAQEQASQLQHAKREYASQVDDYRETVYKLNQQLSEEQQGREQAQHRADQLQARLAG